MFGIALVARFGVMGGLVFSFLILECINNGGVVRFNGLVVA